jgi:hypothetical protein
MCPFGFWETSHNGTQRHNATNCNIVAARRRVTGIGVGFSRINMGRWRRAVGLLVSAGYFFTGEKKPCRSRVSMVSGLLFNFRGKGH